MRERALQHATLDTLAIQLQYVGLTRNGPSADRAPPTRRAVLQAHRLGPTAPPTAEPQLLGDLLLYMRYRVHWQPYSDMWQQQPVDLSGELYGCFVRCSKPCNWDIVYLHHHLFRRNVQLYMRFRVQWQPDSDVWQQWSVHLRELPAG
eukprot:CAMPEP_0174361738 /NCGR_PEP_ID=MMETSP0811_2-20130205/60634_1 /TAXON_ID=73025 ORGANISM="Eutreptiella gymnastica-like, Strain CCMP1594" /NCGR_SAMPLE_ID=MMETSP0811_2 /ASSEMBLY_ACC=CAM_ASM_000667 /LENGTH=147 /DNA_ID=CAMNT_0015498639 /DNA_START=50 /DNA_END=490 /DNA_ORIENTATION=-